MFTPEGFRDVARPTNGLVGGEDFREFLRRHIVPAHGFGIRGQQSGDVPGPFRDAIHGLVAIDASLALVPSRHDVADETPLPHGFDLGQAVLGAALLFRPARTILKAEVYPAPKTL